MSSSTAFVLLTHILSVGSIAVCAVTGLLCLRELKTSVRMLAVHAILSFYVDALASMNSTVNNHIIFIWYMPFDIILVLLAARDYVGHRFIPAFLCGLAIFFGVYFYVLHVRGRQFIPFEAVVTSFLIQGLFWFWALLRILRQPLKREAVAIYLISGGLLIYVCCTIPNWSMFRYGMKHYPSMMRVLQSLSSLTNISRYIGTAIAFILLANYRIPQKQHAGR